MAAKASLASKAVGATAVGKGKTTAAAATASANDSAAAAAATVAERAAHTLILHFLVRDLTPVLKSVTDAAMAKFLQTPDQFDIGADGSLDVFRAKQAEVTSFVDKQFESHVAALARRVLLEMRRQKLRSNTLPDYARAIIQQNFDARRRDVVRLWQTRAIALYLHRLLEADLAPLMALRKDPNAKGTYTDITCERATRYAVALHKHFQPLIDERLLDIREVYSGVHVLFDARHTLKNTDMSMLRLEAMVRRFVVFEADCAADMQSADDGDGDANDDAKGDEGEGDDDGGERDGGSGGDGKNVLIIASTSGDGDGDGGGGGGGDGDDNARFVLPRAAAVAVRRAMTRAPSESEADCAVAIAASVCQDYKESGGAGGGGCRGGVRGTGDSTDDAVSARHTLPYSAIVAVQETGSVYGSQSREYYAYDHALYAQLRAMTQFYSTYKYFLTFHRTADAPNNTELDVDAYMVRQLFTTTNALMDRAGMWRFISRLQVFMHAEASDYYHRIGYDVTIGSDNETVFCIVNDMIATLEVMAPVLQVPMQRNALLVEALADVLPSGTDGGVARTNDKQR